MRKVTTLSLVFILAFVGDLSASASGVVKPGAKCAKVGITQIVGGKKYTCIKTGSKLTWNKGASTTIKATPSANPSSNPTPASESASPSPSQSPSNALVKYKNCTDVKAAGIAPLIKSKTPELYELNSGLDRDKDGVACEN